MTGGMSAALRAVVADDEQLARDELCFLLGQLDGVEVVGQAANGMEALDEIARHAPDVAFLDIGRRLRATPSSCEGSTQPTSGRCPKMTPHP